ncbi:MAG TPA: GPW/gp25 family protein [Thermoanaerobaculia bacterium]|jgi:phage baseplate assembly protein W
MSGREFLGRGWQFPIRVNPRGGLSYSAAEQDIVEALWIILSTAPGERQMLPRFGCGIHDFVFAPNSASTRGFIGNAVRKGLTTWEPRIDVVDVRVDSAPGEPNKLLIRIDYRVRSTNAFHNLVYPFYLKEGKES